MKRLVRAALAALLFRLDDVFWPPRRDTVAQWRQVASFWCWRRALGLTAENLKVLPK